MAKSIIQISEQTHKNLMAVDQKRQMVFDKLPFNRADAVLASCNDQHIYGWLALYWTEAPRFQHYKTACIGSYYAPDQNISQSLISSAQALLQHKGCDFIIAPMEGNTWYDHRLITKHYDEPQFFLDSDTDSAWNHHFTEAGFQRMARYVSIVSECLDYSEDDISFWQARFQSDPAYSRKQLDMTRLDQQLEDIYRLCLKGFRNNFLYTDITQAEFERLYRPILPMINPELIQLIYFHNELIGLSLTIPDYQQKFRGLPIDTLILKSLVRHPSPEFKKLGAYLVWNTHQIARANGFKRIISAFIHEANVSLDLCLKDGKIIREYMLYGKQL